MPSNFEQFCNVRMFNTSKGNDKVHTMIVLGRGTQDLRRCGAEYLDNMLGVDAKLDSMCADAHYALISLNVTWKFQHTFHFHGTIEDDNIVDRQRTDAHIDDAFKYLDEVWGISWRHKNRGCVRIAFVGVGLSARNGTGLVKFLRSLVVVDVAVINNCKSITTEQNAWIDKFIRRETTVRHIEYDTKDLLQLPSGPSAAPDPCHFINVYQNCCIPADSVITSVVQKILCDNGITCRRGKRLRNGKETAFVTPLMNRCRRIPISTLDCPAT